MWADEGVDMAKKNFDLTIADIERMSGSKRERALRLFEKASFMNDEMMKLQRLLKKKGWTEEYQNGANQCGLKKSSEADVYIALTKNYLATMKQLEDMLSSVPLEPTSKLQSFVDE